MPRLPHAQVITTAAPRAAQAGAAHRESRNARLLAAAATPHLQVNNDAPGEGASADLSHDRAALIGTLGNNELRAQWRRSHQRNIIVVGQVLHLPAG
jgi:hypothetical protein